MIFEKPYLGKGGGVGILDPLTSEFAGITELLLLEELKARKYIPINIKITMATIMNFLLLVMFTLLY